MKKSSKQEKVKGKILTRTMLKYIFWIFLGLLVIAIFILIMILQHLHFEKN